MTLLCDIDIFLWSPCIFLIPTFILLLHVLVLCSIRRSTIHFIYCIMGHRKGSNLNCRRTIRIRFKILTLSNSTYSKTPTRIFTEYSSRYARSSSARDSSESTRHRVVWRRRAPPRHSKWQLDSATCEVRRAVAQRGSSRQILRRSSNYLPKRVMWVAVGSLEGLWAHGKWNRILQEVLQISRIFLWLDLRYIKPLANAGRIYTTVEHTI